MGDSYLQLTVSGYPFAIANHISSGSLFFYHQTVSKELLWGVGLVVREGEIKDKLPGKQLYEYIKSVVEKWQHPFSQKILECAAGSQDYEVFELKDRDPLSIDKKTKRMCNSSTGRLTLLGDAAHPMLPFRAAGGNNALLDAKKLTEELSQLLLLEKVDTKDIQNRLSAYEQEMCVRGMKSVVESRNAGQGFHTANKFARFLQRQILSLVNWRINVYPRNRAKPWLYALAALGIVGGIAAAYRLKYP